MLPHCALLFTLSTIGCHSYGYGTESDYSLIQKAAYSPSGRSHGSYGRLRGSTIIPAAINRHHFIRYYNVPNTGYARPIILEIGAHSVPIKLHFRTVSTNLNVQQYHDGAKGSYQETHSEDEPNYLKHTVKKPVYQEVREVISPYRKIIQEIEPVQVSIKTIIARAAHGHSLGLAGSLGLGGATGAFAGALSALESGRHGPH